MQADSVVPIPNSNPEEIRQIMLSLIVDYHETDLLSQLNGMYRDNLTQKAKLSKEQTGKKQQLNLQSENKASIPEEFDKTNDRSLENLSPVNFNNISDIGKLQSSTQQREKRIESNRQNQQDGILLRLNSTSMDRFSYVSNCPTSYTDPSGHCDAKHIIAGGGLILLGGFVIYASYYCFAGALSTLEIHLAGACAVIGGIAGALGILGGVAVLVKDDCIPNFMDLKLYKP